MKGLRPINQRRLEVELDHAACALAGDRVTDPRECPPKFRNVLRTLVDEALRIYRLDNEAPDALEQTLDIRSGGDPHDRPTARPPSRPDHKIVKVPRLT